MTLFATIALGASFMSTSNSKPHVMILGTYHMANPGLDIANVKADDVTTPKRQKEIADVVSELAKFKPTKIVLEAPLNDEAIQSNYHNYLNGSYELKKNERDQLGFRLAKQLGHSNVYPVDVQGDFPFDAVQKFAQSHNRQKEMEQAMGEMMKEVDKINGWLKSGTILQTLKHMNSASEIANGQALYMKLANFSAKDDYAGPDLLAAWYQRNIRIWSNIRSLITSPDERVLVIYGAGHSYWFERNVLDSGDLILDRF